MIDYDRLWHHGQKCPAMFIILTFDFARRGKERLEIFWHVVTSCEILWNLPTWDTSESSECKNRKMALTNWSNRTGSYQISKIGLVRPLLYLFGEGEESSKHPASCASREPATKSTPWTSSVNNIQQISTITSWALGTMLLQLLHSRIYSCRCRGCSLPFISVYHIVDIFLLCDYSCLIQYFEAAAVLGVEANDTLDSWTSYNFHWSTACPRNLSIPEVST